MVYRTPHIIFGSILNGIILLVITKSTTGSLNPMEVYRGDSLLLKIVVSFVLFALVAGALNLLIRRGMEDKRCGKCGKSLLDFAGPYGNPQRCVVCGTWYHSRCFKQDGGTMLEGCRQPHCSSGLGNVA